MRCVSLSEKMMSYDEFDNVDAKLAKDGLPDFSGETIVSLLDFSRPSCDSLSSTATDSLLLREMAVKGALAALDSSMACKVLIICSPSLAARGADDVADLFDRIGCDVPVISSNDTTFSLSKACFKVMREKNLFTHNIAYPIARLMMIIGNDDPDFPEPLLYDDNLVPEVFADTVSVFAPDTYVSYVQNKYNSRGNR